jgi:hypothetical protein
LSNSPPGHPFGHEAQQPSTAQRLLWKGVAFASGTAAVLGVRRAGAAVWRTSRHEDPPTQPAARNVRWRDALVWATSIAVGAAVARVVAERAAASAWNAATGTTPPLPAS